jgi:hypothetical protein
MRTDIAVVLTAADVPDPTAIGGPGLAVPGLLTSTAANRHV